ncbi:hypothetical protein NBT05_02515 [Aquimarina sp. ERC-38]|uniref:hypothetical protein n=1 Tax=Aquimarina sp. ERC-38 TaxID=2949996 RepID=UPI002245DB54|nr:hypothetical protein [Aquimarina sp. ERC-38]UZO81355.1 hypothetical protein NBT05_02515 [Aquimarina sp. ERC-38]
MSELRRKRVEKLLNEIQDIISIQAFERKLNLTRGTIYKFLKEQRKLKNSEIKVLDNYFKDILNIYFD